MYNKVMDAAATNPRQERGAALAKGKAKSFKHISGDVFFVPSQTNTGSGYVVDVTGGKCSCPDFEERGGTCKHQWAVRYFRHELEMPDGSFVVTQGIRLTYAQDWASYNRAQCQEESTVKVLLASLCDGIEQPVQKMGRPRMALRDVVFGSTMKVFGTMSGRRSTTDLRACEDAGHVGRAPAYNTVFKYMEKPELLPLLSRLVDESARPLAAVERNFAVDGTGFASPTYVRWFDYKHGEDRRVQQWVKLHAAVGTLTNVVTAATVTVGSANDSPEFAGLVERTAANFDVREVSADKAYLSHANLATVEKVGGVPFVPFKSNSGSTGSDAWERMYHYFSLNRDAFLSHYHRRSNVESTFSAMKRKFGPGVRSKTQVAQFNEVLLKCLCHNLSCLVHSIHELGVEPQFWQPKELQA
jgi:transposase